MQSRWAFGLVMLAGGVLIGLLLGLVLTDGMRYRPRSLSESALPERGRDILSSPGVSVSSFTTPQTPSPAAVKVALTRKLIREVWLTLKVQDVLKAVQQVRQIAEQVEGYIANASQSCDDEGKWSAELVLRVPSERYHEALSHLQKLGQVDNLSEQVQDVTEEFIDLEARLRNLKES